MQIDSGSAPEDFATPRHASARRVLLATMALSTVALALSLAPPLSNQRTGAVLAAATATSAPHAGAAATGMLQYEGVPLFFGFLEFDWEAGRIPGFGPWPAGQQPR
jgi:hypothetical protein